MRRCYLLKATNARGSHVKTNEIETAEIDVIRLLDTENCFKIKSYFPRFQENNHTKLPIFYKLETTKLHLLQLLETANHGNFETARFNRQNRRREILSDPEIKLVRFLKSIIRNDKILKYYCRIH